MDSCVHYFVVCCLNKHSQDIMFYSSPPLTATTNTASTSTAPVPLIPSQATPPPPGLPSPAPAQSTPGGYNDGQPQGSSTGQGETVSFPFSGIGEPTNQLYFIAIRNQCHHPNSPGNQTPRPPNQPSPRGVTPHLLAQRSPYLDGMMNPQHGEVGPRPAGVGTFYDGNGATGMSYSKAVAGPGSEQDIGSAVTVQPSSTHHPTGIVTKTSW